MMINWHAWGLVALLLLASGCAQKPAPPPPAPPPPAPAPAPAPNPNVVVLLPDPAGKPSEVVLTNQAGTQTLSQPYDSVRWASNAEAPGAPSAMDPADVKRIFGATLEALPQPEVLFVLYFAGDSDVLLPESRAQVPAILNAIQERKSTSITVVGHTDTTATAEYNYQLGLRRARGVSAILRDAGVKDADLFVTSHGDGDPAVKTARNVAERLNRRVEVIVR